MKLTLNKCNILLFFICLFTSACTVSVEDDTNPQNSSIKITGIDTFGWIYSDLIFEGSGLDADCSRNKVALTKDGTSVDLDINDCKSNEVIAWIPEDLDTGTYVINVEIDGNSFNAIDGELMEVEVKNRPVMLSVDKTEVAGGETIIVTGLHFLNPTTLSQNDPKVWIMASGYTNTVSEITVNDEGTMATIILDEDIDPGVYNFLLTTDEWSNEIQLTIL